MQRLSSTRTKVQQDGGLPNAQLQRIVATALSDPTPVSHLQSLASADAGSCGATFRKGDRALQAVARRQPLRRDCRGPALAGLFGTRSHRRSHQRVRAAARLRRANGAWVSAEKIWA